MSSPFTLTIDWLAFTLPSGLVQDTMQMVEATGPRAKPVFAATPILGSPPGQAVALANSEPEPRVRLAKYMWICPVALSLPGLQGRSMRCSNGFCSTRVT